MSQSTDVLLSRRCLKATRVAKWQRLLRFLQDVERWYSKVSTILNRMALDLLIKCSRGFDLGGCLNIGKQIMLETDELIVMCSSQPGFLRSFGGRLASRFRLLECYSLSEAAQMIQLHRPSLALLDLRKAQTQQFDRSWAMAQNSETTLLVVVTHLSELHQSQIPAELMHRVVHLEMEDLTGELDDSINRIQELLQTPQLDRLTPTPEANAEQASQEPLASLAERYRTRTPALRQVLDRLEVAARHDVTMLLIGETGSGKTHLAQLIHETSARAGEPLVTVACGALPRDLIESELFGHAKGSFTSAHADKDGKFLAAGRGTILLDEIDVLSPDQQVKLLRVIEEGLFEPVGSNETLKVEARIIAASNVELEPLVERGRFRPDLYYRLNMLSFVIPPLRKRLPDIEVLARYFVHLHAEQQNLGSMEVTPQFLECLANYPWPGNVREMENAIRSAVIYSQHGQLTMDTLPPNIVSGAAGPGNNGAPLASMSSGRRTESLGNRIELTEKDIIEQALLKNSFSRTKTARQLGISRVTLYNKMKKYGMMPSK